MSLLNSEEIKQDWQHFIITYLELEETHKCHYIQHMAPHRTT